MDDVKIPLPKFLKLLTENDVPMTKAMNLAGKIYKEYNTPSKLRQLDPAKLSSAGLNSQDDRRLVMTALRKSGYVPTSAPRKPLKSQADDISAAGPSTPMTTVQLLTTPNKGKRKRANSPNELLPEGPVDEAARYGDLTFNEVLDEEILKSKFIVINRAPLMTAWAAIVSERIGFGREEALSIASVYTEMTAIAKGVSLNIYEDGKNRGLEASKGGSQSYVELMGRRIPLYRTQTDKWRALSNGSPVRPSVAFSYISRAFRQTTPYIIGSLKLLASSFTSQEINSKAWGLYADFRPDVDGWGKRSEVKCSTILDLRKRGVLPTDVVGAVNLTMNGVIPDNNGESPWSPQQKRVLTFEEYEANLDHDFGYGEFDLT